MNNIVMRKVTVTAAFQPVTSQASEIASVEISASPDNSGPVLFQGDDGSEVPFQPGEYHNFVSVDLAKFRIKGIPGDVVTLVGGTW